MSQVHNFSTGGGTFEWFIGVVEDRNDPKKLGRVKVRAFGYYDGAAIPTADLPWAQVLQNVESAAQKGVGSSPTGIQVGSHVVGFFADGKNAQTPIIMGTLAGAPNGVPDTNALARGEDLDTTVIDEKTQGITRSRADGNALSSAGPIANVTAMITQTVNNAKASVNSARDKMATIGDKSIMGGLNSISQIVTAIATAPAQAKALKDQLEWQVSSVKGQIENLKNLDPEEMAERFAQMQVRDVEASIRALQSLNFDSLMDQIQSIPIAIGQIDRLADSLVRMADLGNIVTDIKGLARSIPGVGQINALSRTVASANQWSEPATPAAPEYPMNKIMETEGGHIEEFDDTPGAERYHRYHPAGSFVEVHPDGTTVNKIVKDDYSVTLGDKYIHIEGKVQVNIVGDSTIVVNGNATTSVSGDKTDIVKGNYSLAVGGDISVTSGSALEMSAAAQLAAKAARIDLN